MLAFLLSLTTAGATPTELVLKTVAPDAIGNVRTRTLRWAGGDIVELHQTVGGLPVHGKAARAIVGPAGEIRFSAGQLLDSAPSSLDPTITATQAKAIAENALFSRDLLWPTRTELVVTVDAADSPILAWSVTVGHAHPLNIWSLTIDAIDGHIIANHPDLLRTTGYAFPESPAFSEPRKVPLQRLESDTRLLGWYATSYSCTEWFIDPKPFGRRDCLALEVTAQPDLHGDYKHLPRYGDTFDPFTEVHTYHHVDRIADWAAERYGIEDDRPIDVINNFPLTNAFYGDFDGDGHRDLSFGISDDGLNLGYDADIIYHEFGHHIVRSIAGPLYTRGDEWGIDHTPGAFNEGTADIFSLVFNGDPLLGEYMAQSSRWDKAIRDLEADRTCPGDLQNQIHRDGEIWGAMGWNLIDDPRVGPDAVADLLIGTLVRFDKTTGWAGAGQALLDAATDLYEAQAIDDDAVQAIEEQLNLSGILDCTRFIPLDATVHSAQYLLNLGLEEPYERMPVGTQFVVEVPTNGHTMVVHLSGTTSDETGTGWTVYVRAGAPVEFESEPIEDLGLPHATAVAFDAQFDGENDGEIVIDSDTMPALVAGEIYYLAVTSKNLTREALDVAYDRVVISAEVHIHEAGNPISNQGQGCRCSQGGRPWAPFVFCAVSLLIRRRQRPLLGG